MLKVFRKWTASYFADEEALILLFLIVGGLALIVSMGDILAPIIASVIIAFLLQGLITQLMRRGLPEWLTILIAFMVFVGAALVVILVVLPLAWRQLSTLFNELPNMLAQGQATLSVLPKQYPGLVSAQEIDQIIAVARTEIGKFGQVILSFSISTIPNILAVMIYAILIPILVFFFLKDRVTILNWLGRFLPDERPLMNQVWQEMNMQIANYVRGKAIEILVVGSVSYVSFALMGLNYAALLGLLVGLSVVVPYIGAAVVTIPVAVIAYFQWGLTPDFYYLLVVYGIIQALDGNVLVPLLFSEAVNLHPVAIILAVLVFGGFWGLWGVFFAIPLATLIKAIISAWPNPHSASSTTPAPDASGESKPGVGGGPTT